MTPYTRKAISIVILAAFISTSIKSPVFAQTLDPLPHMPMPGIMVHLSPEYVPAYLKGIVIHPENALKFDFIVYKGDKKLTDAQKRVEYTKLTKYFLASLAIPDDDQWVNLSPYEKDRIIKDDFGKTEMGRDLLAQDYMLKQITASLIYPEDNLGKKFWDKVYAQAQERFGTSDIPINTFNKVWILPDSAVIYEKGNTAYVLKNHLKVMLEEDYLSLQKHSGIANIPPLFYKEGARGSSRDINSLGSKIVKEIILPELEREVNEGKNFAPLRQVYSGMLLAAWYKRALKESLLSRIYANKSKVKGVDQDPKNNEQIYHQYLRAYKKGVFNFIKEDVDKYTHETIPRKYFSGGTTGYPGDAAAFAKVVKIDHDIAADQALTVKEELNTQDDDVAILAEERTSLSKYMKQLMVMLPHITIGDHWHATIELRNGNKFIVLDPNNNYGSFDRFYYAMEGALMSGSIAEGTYEGVLMTLGFSPTTLSQFQEIYTQKKNNKVSEKLTQDDLVKAWDRTKELMAQRSHKLGLIDQQFDSRWGQWNGEIDGKLLSDREDLMPIGRALLFELAYLQDNDTVSGLNKTKQELMSNVETFWNAVYKIQKDNLPFRGRPDIKELTVQNAVGPLGNLESAIPIIKQDPYFLGSDPWNITSINFSEPDFPVISDHYTYSSVAVKRAVLQAIMAVMFDEKAQERPRATQERLAKEVAVNLDMAMLEKEGVPPAIASIVEGVQKAIADLTDHPESISILTEMERIFQKPVSFQEIRLLNQFFITTYGFKALEDGVELKKFQESWQNKTPIGGSFASALVHYLKNRFGVEKNPLISAGIIELKRNLATLRADLKSSHNYLISIIAPDSSIKQETKEAGFVRIESALKEYSINKYGLNILQKEMLKMDGIAITWHGVQIAQYNGRVFIAFVGTSNNREMVTGRYSPLERAINLLAELERHLTAQYGDAAMITGTRFKDFNAFKEAMENGHVDDKLKAVDADPEAIKAYFFPKLQIAFSKTPDLMARLIEKVRNMSSGGTRSYTEETNDGYSLRGLGLLPSSGVISNVLLVMIQSALEGANAENTAPENAVFDTQSIKEGTEITFRTTIGRTVTGRVKNINRAAVVLEGPSISKYKNNWSWQSIDPKSIHVVDVAMNIEPGGIDFNAAHLNLQIKRDGKGIPLPISQQDLENIKIDGLTPIIIDIKPTTSLTIFLELKN